MSIKRLTLPLLAVAMCAVAGCVYKGAKVTEGTDLSIGLSIPGTDGVAQLSILNWLSGFRLGVAQYAQLDLEYTVCETNSYLGIVTTQGEKRVRATVTPVEEGSKAAPGLAEGTK